MCLLHSCKFSTARKTFLDTEKFFPVLRVSLTSLVPFHTSFIRRFTDYAGSWTHDLSITSPTLWPLHHRDATQFIVHMEVHGMILICLLLSIWHHAKTKWAMWNCLFNVKCTTANIWRSRRTNGQIMARFHQKTKKKQFEIFAKIAQISLPWQQIKIRTTFCSFCHGELMAKKWLDSIEKQGRRIDLKERYKHTNIQTGAASTNRQSQLLTILTPS